MNKKNINFDYKRLHPFKWFILENYPFLEDSIDVLTNYQLFCKLGEMYNKQVEVINTLGIQVETLTDWFDDLDLQEEVNNKLDEMAESGELEELIAAYINTNALICFDTIEDLKESENLVDGSYAKTLGYYSKNDGGESTYKIRTITNEDVVDEASIIALNDENLIAELIINDTINPNQFGCYGDNTHDDTLNLQKCLDYAINNKVTLISKKKNTFKVSDTLEINDIIQADFGNSEINGDFEDDILKINVTDDSDYIENKENYYVFGGYLKNLIINGNNKATKGLYVLYEKKMTLNNIEIINCVNGLYIHSATECIFDTIRVQKCSIGVYTEANDILLENIFGRFCNIGLYLNDYAQVVNSHFWVRPDETEFTNSVYAKVFHGARLENAQIDSYETGIETDGTGGYTINLTGMWQQPSTSTQTFTLFKFTPASYDKTGGSIRLSNFHGVCKETTPYVNFSDINSDTFTGFIDYDSCRFLNINKFPLSTHLKLTDISSSVTEVHNRVNVDGHRITVDFIGLVTTTFHNLTIAKMPNVPIGENPFVPMGFVGSTSNQYNLGSNDMTFSGLVLRNHNIMVQTNNNTDIPVNKYVHIHFSYIAESEQNLNENIPE